MIYFCQLPFHVYVPFIKQLEPGIGISMYCYNLQGLLNEFFKNLGRQLKKLSLGLYVIVNFNI